MVQFDDDQRAMNESVDDLLRQSEQRKQTMTDNDDVPFSAPDPGQSAQYSQDPRADTDVDTHELYNAGLSAAGNVPEEHDDAAWIDENTPHADDK